MAFIYNKPRSIEFGLGDKTVRAYFEVPSIVVSQGQGEQHRQMLFKPEEIGILREVFYDIANILSIKPSEDGKINS